MKKILLGLFVIGFVQLNAQNAMEVLESTFAFLSSKNSVAFKSHASMSHDYDSLTLMENFTYAVKLKDYKKIHFSWTDGMKRKLINYNGKELTFFSLDDSFFSKYNLDGDLNDLKKFVGDSLDYDMPFISLFSETELKEILKSKPKSYFVGTKTFKGLSVHHLVFHTANFSWQMFVSADEDNPVPYKIVVNDLENGTEFSCEFTNWDFSEIKNSEFGKSIGDFIEIKQGR